MCARAVRRSASSELRTSGAYLARQDSRCARHLRLCSIRLLFACTIQLYHLICSIRLVRYRRQPNAICRSKDTNLEHS